VLAWLECGLLATHDAGDHELVIGSVQDMGVTRGRPLVYYRGGFGRFES
jgi:flavin reductase (DIM6/NTAB) family NADH-FMN oxidoreductase RutF